MEGAHREGGLSAPRAATFAANKLFFPAAAAYGALVLPLSMLPFLGAAPAVAGLASPAAHAHEMLFGFALAVVAGHQLGPVRVPVLGAFFALWALARVASLVAPGGSAALALNGAFAIALASRLVPRLLATIKKPRNLAMPLALAALCACAIAAELVRAPGDGHAVMVTAVAVFALLMLFIGGRLLAPAIAGQFYRQHDNLSARVQPRLEAALVIAMTVAIAASVFTESAVARAASALALAVSGVIAAVRLARWRLWRLQRRPDLWCLAAGYAWLAAGLVWWGGALAGGEHLFAALHAITIGSLGTLTLNVMALTWARQARVDPAATHVTVWATALIAGATVARAAADFPFADRQLALAAAAACWSAAYALLLVRMATLPRRAHVHRHD